MELFQTLIDANNLNKTSFRFRLRCLSGDTSSIQQVKAKATTFEELYCKLVIKADQCFLDRFRRSPNISTVLWEESEHSEPVRLDLPKDLKAAVERCTTTKFVKKRTGERKAIKVLDIFVREPGDPIIPLVFANDEPQEPLCTFPEDAKFSTTISDLPEELLTNILQRIDLVDQQKLHMVCSSWDMVLSDLYMQRRVNLSDRGLRTTSEALLGCLALLGPLTEYICYDAENSDKINYGDDDEAFQFLLDNALLKCPRLKHLSLCNMVGSLKPSVLLQLSNHVQRLTLVNVYITFTPDRHSSTQDELFYTGPATCAYFRQTTIEWGKEKEHNLWVALDHVLREFLSQKPYTMQWVIEGVAFVVANGDDFDRDQLVCFIRSNEKHLKNLQVEELKTLDLSLLRASTLCDVCAVISDCLDRSGHTKENYFEHLERYYRQVPCNSYFFVFTPQL